MTPTLPAVSAVRAEWSNETGEPMLTLRWNQEGRQGPFCVSLSAGYVAALLAWKEQKVPTLSERGAVMVIDYLGSRGYHLGSSVATENQTGLARVIDDILAADRQERAADDSAGQVAADDTPAAIAREIVTAWSSVHTAVLNNPDGRYTTVLNKSERSLDDLSKRIATALRGERMTR